MKEAASILLQTIPDSIDIHDFQKQILLKFPQIESIHDLHIWQLTQQKFVSTAHVIFMDPFVYKTIIDDVLGFFHEQGINIVTIQPEFKNLGAEDSSGEELKSLVNGTIRDLCLVACRETACEEKLCCKRKGSIGSTESITVKTKSEAVLEQVISVRNISAEELNALSNFESTKSLNCTEAESSLNTNDGPQKKRSTSSLYNPALGRHKHKLQKAISAIDREHQQIPTTSESEGIHLVSIKKFVSESTIEHDDGSHKNNDILVENRLLQQLDKTDNNEMENLYEKCDKES